MAFTTTLMSIIRAPLFWFLIAGALLFVIDENIQKSTEHNILITEGDLQRIKAQWQTQSGEKITSKVFSALLKEHVEEQQLYKEALNLGLDIDDIIIKRRLIQKLRFLTEDLGAIKSPKNETLISYFDSHKENYKLPQRISFKQIYFSSESRQDKAFSDALNILSLVSNENSSDWKGLGDPFMLGQAFNKTSVTELSELFGEEFVVNITTESNKDWSGPIESLFGFHLIKIEDNFPSKQITFIDSFEQVKLDYKSSQRELAYNKFLSGLSTKYPVVFEDGTSFSYIIKDIETAEQNQ